MTLFEINKKNKFKYSLEIPITYNRFNVGDGRPLLIFFHGFCDSAEPMLKRCYPELLSEFEVLAVNAPFPTPQKKNSQWNAAFAWYFADFSTQTVFISPELAAQAVGALIQELQLVSRPKALIGFSQGGFFMPFVLKHVAEVRYMLSIGSVLRLKDYPEKFDTRVDAIHGDQDEVISSKLARENFDLFKKKNLKGEFQEFTGLGHTMNDFSREWLRKKLKQLLSEGEFAE